MQLNFRGLTIIDTVKRLNKVSNSEVSNIHLFHHLCLLRAHFHMYPSHILSQSYKYFFQLLTYTKICTSDSEIIIFYFLYSVFKLTLNTIFSWLLFLFKFRLYLFIPFLKKPPRNSNPLSVVITFLYYQITFF